MVDDPRRALSGQRVLVVEDERLIALDIRDILEQRGCVVLCPVATVAAALDLVAENPPDRAVLDVQLVNETTEPAAAALRTVGHPFVVLTACQRSHLTRALLDAPVLSKPVDETKLGLELVALLQDRTHR